MLTEEEAKKIKDQLFRHIEENFPEEQIESAKAQINSMSSGQFEEFLEKNRMLRKESPETGQECIFCSIASGKIPSYKIGENEKAIAVLEINPISEAHSLIIPKEHESDLKEPEIKEIEEQIAEKIKRLFHPKEIKIIPSELFGHRVINILPVYTNESMKSERAKADEEQLLSLQKKLAETKEKKSKKKKGEEKSTEGKGKKPEKKKEKAEEKLWLPKRIP